MMRKKISYAILFLVMACLLAAFAYNLPPIHDRLSWRLEEIQVLVKGYISPPERVSFVPQGQAVSAAVAPTLPSATASTTPTATQPPSATAPLSTPLPSATPTLTATPLPPSVALKGVRYMNQHGLWNYCAPANLAMALSYWGWKGDRLDTGKYLKPFDRDKNVMPYEMAQYVTEKTDYKVMVRVAGDLNLIKRFLTDGFPILAEKGAYIKDISGVVSWMGHYEVITGYDDAQSILITQDSYYTPDYPVSYDTFMQGWRSFNYTYLIIYPADKESQVASILGPQAEETANFQYAALKASDEIFALSGVDQFFAWYNRGTNLVGLQDYAGAASAYDEAFAIYAKLPEDKSIRPYRMLWYETGPYFAYYYTGRYYDVMTLATTAIDSALDIPALEESFYWRAMAKAALGDKSGAVADYQESLKYHPDFAPTLYQLKQLGVEP
jgi:tetratricopeptide (TPR) repeat protein